MGRSLSFVCMKFFHHLKARQEVKAIAREQALIEQDEVWLAHAKEFQ
jgi:hypothetical protein